MKQILVVGAGFAGAVYARVLAEAGWGVNVIDRRPHLGGNCYDYVDSNGIRIHAYGPHLFHTSNERVVDWLRRFGDWDVYEHRVKARLGDGREVPLPVNRDTINAVFDLNLATQEEVEVFLASVAIPCESPRNAAEYLNSKTGSIITDLFFRPYTKKMWGFELEDMDASVVKRIPLRYDTEDRYFPDDKFQLMPRQGFSDVFRVILDHPAINVQLSTDFDRAMEHQHAHVFNSMPIDEYFDFRLGELPYRSIRFHHRTVESWREGICPVLNYTDKGPFTRETTWHLVPGQMRQDTKRRSVTIEEPCDYRDNNFERYYPVKTSDGRFGSLYESYRDCSQELRNTTFIGRCGTYRYLDMHQVINQSLVGASRWLSIAATT